MRNDIAKIITERERRSNHWTSKRDKGVYKKRRNRFAEDDIDKLDSLPRKESTFFHNRNNYKGQTDHLSPLKGFFRKNLGKKWDDIFSEISSVVSKKTRTDLHVFEHISDFVEMNVIEKEGKIYYIKNYTWNSDKYELIEKSYKPFYICPITKTLKQIKKKKKQSYKVSKRTVITKYVRKIGEEYGPFYAKFPSEIDSHVFSKKEEDSDVWYEFYIIHGKLDGHLYYDMFTTDKLMKQRLKLINPVYRSELYNLLNKVDKKLKFSHIDYLFCNKKRQLSSKDIKNLELV
jgi:hypothetical protein